MAAADELAMAVARDFRLFARREARGRSAAYEQLAESVADDAAVASFVASLPPDKRQPNLLVICHSSVLYQVSPQQRERFAAAVRGLGASWLSAEAPGILPGTAVPARDDQMYALARDGRLIATADGHGTWLRWLP